MAGDQPSFRIERAWRDMREPNERLEFDWTHEGRRRGRGFAGGVMWRRDEAGAVTISDATETADFMRFWPRDFYTMFGRLARRDPALVLRMGAAHRIEVLDREGAPQGWWEIDGQGNLMRWGATFNAEEELSYIYGPVRAYGPINFIGWGAASSGDFRFEYADVRLSASPLPHSILADRASVPAEDVIFAR